MDALFSSQVGGERLLERIRTAIDETAATATGRTIDVHITAFSFTDQGIADSLRALAQAGSAVTVRIIADWAQGSGDSGRQVASLASSLPNILVRYKRDQPYLWDAEVGRVRWSYRASRGLLHHKTLGIFVDGEPSILICGSFNWTAKAANSYENLLVVTPDDAKSRRLMERMEWEFEAMWGDGSVTLSPEDAASHYQQIITEFRSDPEKLPTAVVGLPEAEGGEMLAIGEQSDSDDEAGSPEQGPVLIAFSSRASHEGVARDGYAARNRDRRFVLQKPSGTLKPVPLTLTTLALDVIGRAKPGDSLCVAMYGLSSRVPEYGALIQSARRGVRVRILLDGSVGEAVRAPLQATSESEGLSLEIRAARSRPMHQKYIVHPEADTVLTGTANLSRDASDRHSEHRMTIRQAPALAAAFLSDFDAIWSRLSA